MVYTVTLNPALDYVVRVDALRAGELNRAKSEEVQLGGKGINVSCVLGELGVDSVALGFAAGFTGKALQELLQRRGIRTDFVWLREGLTRINVKLKAGQETEINGRGPEIPEEALETFFRKLDGLGRGDVLVLAGSIPGTLPGDVYRRILAKVEGRGVLTVVDAAGELLCEALAYRPFLVKPNRAELEEIFGETLGTDAEILACARRLQERGARHVLVSMAGDGSMLLDEMGNVHRLGAPKGRVRNSVGAGDSMVAGFLAGWLRGEGYSAAQRMGAAAGAATAFSDRLATREEIETLFGTFWDE